MKKLSIKKNIFKNFLIENNITFEDYGDNVAVDDNLLRPYENELRKLLPDIQFIWEIEPKERI